MSAGTRLLLAIFTGLLLLTTVTVGLAVAAVHHSGTIAVDVRPEDDAHFSIAMPAAIANLAIAFMPSDLLGELTTELKPVWPTIRAASRELERAPDFTLLEVVSRDGQVLIRKESGRLLITVDDHGDRLSVALPLATVRRIVEKLG